MTGIWFTVRELAERLGGSVLGDGEVALTGVASLASAGPAEVTFVLDARRAPKLAASKAGAAIVGRDTPPAPMPLIRVDDVQAALGTLLGMIGDNEPLCPLGVHPTAVVAEDAELGQGVAIGPGAVVEAGAVLGQGVVLCANATVGSGVSVGDETVVFEGTVLQARCRIGRRCRIGPNAVIGASGFGYFFAGGRHQRICHTGTVEIGDDVDIGACSCVDRAKFGATRIGEGTKIDNLVQVAHNAQIGRGCALASQVAVGGSAVLKDHVVLGGHAAIRDNITIGRDVKAAAFSGIGHDVPDNTTVAGMPAREWRRQLRVWQVTGRLPEVWERLRRLEKRLDALDSSADH